MRVAVGAEIDPQALLARLALLGYERLPEVEAVGQFARRGGIVDVWPASSADPLRLEFDGDTLRSLRRFDPGTQRSLEQLGAATLLPRYEIVIAPEELEAALGRLRGAEGPGAEDGDGRSRAEGAIRPDDPAAGALFQDGLERFAALYDPGLGTLLDYLPEDTLVVIERSRRPARACRGSRTADRARLPGSAARTTRDSRAPISCSCPARRSRS